MKQAFIYNKAYNEWPKQKAAILNEVEDILNTNAAQQFEITIRCGIQEATTVDYIVKKLITIED